MSDVLKSADFAGADTATLMLIVQESDKRVAAQVQVMLATDSRSNTLLSASAALAAASFGVAASQYPTQGLSPLVVGAGAFALTAAFTAVAAVRALWPTAIDVQGWSPVLFVKDIADKKPNPTILADVARLNQAKLDGNATCNAKIAGRVRLAMSLLVAAPFIGGAAAIIRVLWPSCG